MVFCYISSPYTVLTVFCSSVPGLVLHLILLLCQSIQASFLLQFPKETPTPSLVCLCIFSFLPSRLYGSCFQIRQVLLVAWY